MQTSVTLSIKDNRSTIPYPAVEREDAPHGGFVNLRVKPENIAEITPARESAALQQALIRINAGTTPFFSVACRKVVNRQNENFWARGYLEFALNYHEVAKDSPNYFLLFEQFSHYVNKANFDVPVDFSFELHNATFDSIGEEGYTACVWITTAEFPDEDSADRVWNQSVAFLSEFLGSYEKLDLPVICEC